MSKGRKVSAGARIRHYASDNAAIRPTHDLFLVAHQAWMPASQDLLLQATEGGCGGIGERLRRNTYMTVDSWQVDYLARIDL